MESRRQQRLEKKEQVLEKKANSAREAEIGTLVFTGVTAGCAVVATLMGATAGLVSDAVMDYTAQGVYENDSFQAHAREKAKELTDKLTRGEISYQEFKKQYEAIYSTGEVIRYSKTAGDEKLTSVVEDYNESQDMMDTMFTKAVPGFLGLGVVGVGGLAVTEAIRKKYELKLALAKKQLEDEKAVELVD